MQQDGTCEEEKSENTLYSIKAENYGTYEETSFVV